MIKKYQITSHKFYAEKFIVSQIITQKYLFTDY